MVNISITNTQLNEMINLKNGSYYPLKKFVNKKNFISICKKMKTVDGKFFPLPIYFDLDEISRKKLVGINKFNLIFKQKKIGVFQIDEIYEINKKNYLKCIFGTTSLNHPGVKKFISSGKYFISGKFDILISTLNSNYLANPSYLKKIIKKKKIKSIIAFHTRNIPHKAHEWIHKFGLKKHNYLFIHPMVGELKVGDFKAFATIESYKVLIKQIYNKNVILGLFNSYARYAGPKEALFHSIVRRNFGCTHFLVGRDHAGVGKFYKKYESQLLCKKFEKKLKIKIITFKEPFYCKTCNKIINKICNHIRRKSNNKIIISGTKLREKILNRQKIPNYFVSNCIKKFLKKSNIKLV